MPPASTTNGPGASAAGEPDALHVVPLTSADALRVLAVDQVAFFFDPTGIVPDRDTAHLPWPRTFGAVRGGPHSAQPLAGLYTSYPWS